MSTEIPTTHLHFILPDPGQCPECDARIRVMLERRTNELVSENAGLKAQAAMDTIRFREMQEAGERLGADSEMLDWLLNHHRTRYFVSSPMVIYMKREAITNAMQREQAP